MVAALKRSWLTLSEAEEGWRRSIRDSERGKEKSTDGYEQQNRNGRNAQKFRNVDVDMDGKSKQVDYRTN